jgi:hypothetical protein
MFSLAKKVVIIFKVCKIEGFKNMYNLEEERWWVADRNHFPVSPQICKESWKIRMLKKRGVSVRTDSS